MAKKKLEELNIRRAPKYTTFMFLGAAVGIIAALIVNVFSSSDAKAPILGYLMVYFAVVGIGLSLALALVLDRIYRSKSQVVKAERTK